MIEQLKVEKGGKVILLNRENKVIVNQFNGSGGKALSELDEFNLFPLGPSNGCPSGKLLELSGLEGQYYVTCTVNGTTGWKLMVAFPYDLLMASAMEGMKYIVFLEGIMILLMAVALVILSNAMIVDPLKKTIGVMRRLESGDPKARLPEGRSDEFGLLARQFNRLIETVAEYQKHLEEKVRERTEALMQLQRENLRLRLIEEKERIYGYLHDSLGARLTNINISNSVAQSALGKDPETLKAMLGRIEENTLKGIEDLKEILHGSATEDRRIMDFSRFLCARIRDRLQLKDIRLDYAVDGSAELNALPRFTRFELEKIVQELTSNVLKHSKASVVSVRIGMNDRKVILRYSDDGVGGAEEADREGGYGLVNINRRVMALGGSFELVSPVGGGTTVYVELPATEEGAGS
jgi:signal transduction histidine kinase